MKPMKLTSLVMMLLIAFSAAAQEEFFDDVYFSSKNKKKKEQVEEKKVVQPKQESRTLVATAKSQASSDSRDVDEYNRRYDSRDNDFVMENDTLYINEKEDDGLDGEWVNGEFEGSQDDYEYATRIIRFRNPRYAISISSPLYWDVVYGLNSWDWNVYTDGLYAYAFPTFTNRLWWDWRYNSYGWGGLSLLWLGMEQLVRSELELWLGRLVRRWLVGTSSSPSLSSRILSRWRWSLGRWPLGKCIYQ